MFSRFIRIASACVTFTVLGAGAAAAQTAPSATPSPAAGTTNDRTGGSPSTVATPAPGFNPFNLKGLTISGTLRAYDFNRLNTPEYNAKGAATGPNRYAFNFGGDLRADYRLGDTPFSIGGALWGAYPFGLNGGSVGCNVGGGLIVHESQALCSKNNAGIDNSLPGYPLETFEYYVKYTDRTAQITVGNQLLNKTWEPASDSRIKPSLYQGIDATFNVSPIWAIGLTRITRFEDRTESTFDDCTLLNCTTTPAGVGGAAAASDFGTKTALTTGADRVAFLAKPSTGFTVDTEVYRFHNIANLTYFEARDFVLPKNEYNPFVAFQFIDETQAGHAIVGRVQNQTVGAQIGAAVVKNLVLTLGTDYAPWNYANVTATSAAAAAAGYFLPGGGTSTLVAAGVNASQVTAVKIGPDRYKVAYGGIASPYSDSYASDPLYTTSISQGMVDRRSPGFSNKLGLTYTGLKKQLIASASEASYNYDNQFARNRTYEFDADVTYEFNKVRAGAYKGLSLRERFADRTQPTLPYNFKYVRHQLQYSF